MSSINMSIRVVSELKAQAERKNGYVGRNAREVLAEMDQIISDAEGAGE